jgi:nucleoside-diphosphate-sugar epimerase
MATVLITGAGGSLGRVVAPLLEERGDVVRLLDSRPVDLPYASTVGDIRDADAVREAVRDADAIVHGAAIHGIHVDKWSAQDFWSINATGTFNVYDAAREHGVRRVVLCSTMAVYGASAQRSDDAWAVVDDESPVQPVDVYGMSKHVCETLARDAARTWSIGTVSLRLGMFVPETFERYGFRLLFGGIDDRDVAQAVLLALDHHPADGFDAFNVFAEVPFSDAEASHLANDPGAVIERHWPGTLALVEERKLDLRELIWGWAIWRSRKTQEVWGWRPAYGFGEFLTALRADEASFYPFGDQPRWGV